MNKKLLNTLVVFAGLLITAVFYAMLFVVFVILEFTEFVFKMFKGKEKDGNS